MRRVVIDASAFLGWFTSDGPGRRLRDEYEHGLVAVVAPRTFALGVLEAAAALPGWGPGDLQRLAGEIDRLGLELRDPPSDELAAWLGKGLGGMQASQAALASALDLPLVTDDPDLRRVAASIIGH